MKICTKCKLEKDLDEFYKTKTTKDGYTYNCKSCHEKYREDNREKQRLYMQNLRERNRELINSKKRLSWSKMDPVERMYQQAKGRAKRLGIEFNIEKQDIILPKECPLLDTTFLAGTKNNYQYSWSLDRIDASKGYIKGNVWVISSKANTMKSNASKEELILFALNILKHFAD